MAQKKYSQTAAMPVEFIIKSLRDNADDSNICGVDAGRSGSCNARYTMEEAADCLEAISSKLGSALERLDIRQDEDGSKHDEIDRLRMALEISRPKGDGGHSPEMSEQADARKFISELRHGGCDGSYDDTRSKLDLVLEVFDGLASRLFSAKNNVAELQTMVLERNRCISDETKLRVTAEARLDSAETMCAQAAEQERRLEADRLLQRAAGALAEPLGVEVWDSDKLCKVIAAIADYFDRYSE